MKASCGVHSHFVSGRKHPCNRRAWLIRRAFFSSFNTQLLHSQPEVACTGIPIKSKFRFPTTRVSSVQFSRPQTAGSYRQQDIKNMLRYPILLQPNVSTSITVLFCFGSPLYCYVTEKIEGKNSKFFDTQPRITNYLVRTKDI